MSLSTSLTQGWVCIHPNFKVAFWIPISILLALRPFLWLLFLRDVRVRRTNGGDKVAETLAIAFTLLGRRLNPTWIIKRLWHGLKCLCGLFPPLSDSLVPLRFMHEERSHSVKSLYGRETALLYIYICMYIFFFHRICNCKAVYYVSTAIMPWTSMGRGN